MLALLLLYSDFTKLNASYPDCLRIIKRDALKFLRILLYQLIIVFVISYLVPL